MTAVYAQRVGERLRKVREQQRLSLKTVEASSGNEFKASVLGAYERGDRAISVPRLQRLANFYNVPVDQLLPTDDGGPEHEARKPTDGDNNGKITIDLTRLDAAPIPERNMIGRYLGTIQVQRQDFNGRVLTIRGEDVRAIASMLDTSPEQMRHRFEELGLRR